MVRECSTSVRKDIVEAIAKATDDNIKAILLLMLGIIEEIGGRIESMRADEHGLREAVLNGHASNHDRDHSFVGGQYEQREQIAEERRWVQERMKSDCSTACAWAKGKMVEEAEAAKDAADLIRAGKKAAVEQTVRTAVLAALFFVAGAIGMAHYMK